MTKERQKSTDPHKRKPQPDPYTSKIKKQRSERQQDDALRHAVRTHDVDTLDDWDEPEY